VPVQYYYGLKFFSELDIKWKTKTTDQRTNTELMITRRTESIVRGFVSVMAAVLATLIFETTTFGQSTYSVIDLGTLPGGTGSTAVAINNNGQVVGYADTSNAITHAFLYSGGKMIDLGTLGGSFSSASGINDNGQVVGTSTTTRYASHVFLSSGSGMSDLGTFAGSPVSPTAINNSGEIVGYYGGPYKPTAVVYRNGGWTNILSPLFSYYSYAYGINNADQIVLDEVSPSNGYTGGYEFSNGNLIPVGSFGGQSKAFAINDNGQVVGWSQIGPGGVAHAFRDNGGGPTDLGTLGTSSEALAINNNGDIVGRSITTNGETHAFLYTNGVMVDLNNLVSNSNWEFVGINDHGEIVGNGNAHAFLLSPSSDLAVTFLGFDPQAGGLGLTYTNQGGPLPAQTTAKLYWASGTTTNDIITNAPLILLTNIPAGFTGQATNYIPESWLSSPPTNATYFLLVLNPDNLVTESTQANNTASLQNTFRHVVLVMMENRSFDHLLGWLPGADGKQEGLSYTNAKGTVFSTRPLAPSFQGCTCTDPDHSYVGARIEYNNGRCDGWLLANTNDTFSIGYYTQNDLWFLGKVAPNWTVCDRYFAAIMAETQPNRMYQHCAQTDSLIGRDLCDPNSWHFVTLPTIWDSLEQQNVSRRYYKAGTGIGSSFLQLWGPLKYNSITSQVDQFYRDCKNGSLPAVSFIDPTFTSGSCGSETPASDDHPHSDIRDGEVFLANVYSNIVTSPNWSSTVLIINFDEWGGFFDHVSPPVLPPYQIPPDEAALGNDGTLGFRVPCLVISPWSRGSKVVSEQFDHCSVLKMIERRWQLPTLTVRDATANNLADALNLAHPDFSQPPPVNVPQGPFGKACRELVFVHLPNTQTALIYWPTSPCKTLQLQTTTELNGPWTDVPASSPPYVTTVLNPEYFFRLVTK
jgi:phospholipase C